MFSVLVLEPETSIYKWLFQLDDSKPLLGKWLFHQTSIKTWLFRVPGWYHFLTFQSRKLEISKGFLGKKRGPLCSWSCPLEYPSENERIRAQKRDRFKVKAHLPIDQIIRGFLLVFQGCKYEQLTRLIWSWQWYMQQKKTFRNLFSSNISHKKMVEIPQEYAV